MFLEHLFVMKSVIINTFLHSTVKIKNVCLSLKCSLGKDLKQIAGGISQERWLGMMVQSPPESTKTYLRSLVVDAKKLYSQIPYVSGSN